MKEVGINIMKYPKLFAAIGITLVSAFLFSIFGNAQQSDDGFNLSQKEQINSLIREYILENPEIIPEAVEILRARQNANAFWTAESCSAGVRKCPGIFESVPSGPPLK